MMPIRPPTPEEMVHWEGGQSEATIQHRVGRLKKVGFADGEIELMKFVRLYPHWVIDNKGVERYSTAGAAYYRRRIRAVERLARQLKVSTGEAAARIRAKATAEIERWQEELLYTGLPPDYDPINQMGYAEFIYA